MCGERVASGRSDLTKSSIVSSCRSGKKAERDCLDEL